MKIIHKPLKIEDIRIGKKVFYIGGQEKPDMTYEKEYEIFDKDGDCIQIKDDTGNFKHYYCWRFSAEIIKPKIEEYGISKFMKYIKARTEGTRV